MTLEPDLLNPLISLQDKRIPTPLILCPGTLWELVTEKAAPLLPNLLTLKDLAPGLLDFPTGGATVRLNEVIQALPVLTPVEFPVALREILEKAEKRIEKITESENK